MNADTEYISNSGYAKATLENNCSLALRLMLEDIHRKSTPVTPKRVDPIGGTLRNNVHKQMISPLQGEIAWNTPYAEYQERGWIIRNGKLILFKNYSTPGTGSGFAQKALNDVMSHTRDYFIQTGVIK